MSYFSVRKWRKKTRIGGDGGWEWEVGEEGHYARQLHAAETDLLRESSSAVSSVAVT